MANAYSILLAPNPSLLTGPGTNTIVLGRGIEGATVIDPADDSLEHLEAIIQEGKKRGGIRRILVTHGHPDHVGGALALRRQLDVFIYAFNRQGVPEADEEVPDGMTFPAGKDTLRAIHTPGHRFDHLCFLLEQERTLFAGDLISGWSTVVISPSEGDMQDYLNSLKRLQKLKIKEIVPGHGLTIPAAQKKLSEYIAHRLHREQQILNLLHSVKHPLAITTIVEYIYASTDPRLHTLAAQSVAAHLLKLEREDRVLRVKGEKSEESKEGEEPQDKWGMLV